MGINIDATAANSASLCCRCGKSYSRKKGNYLTSYAQLYKGTSYLPYCTSCTDEIFLSYLERGAEPRDAVRQMCRKLDLYWSQKVFDSVDAMTVPSRAFNQYLRKISTMTYAGKSYDDTLREEGALWEWSDNPKLNKNAHKISQTDIQAVEDEDEISKEDIAFWGSGYNSKSVYDELNQKYEQWTSNLGELDPAEQSIYKQICVLEYTINKDSAAGKSIDKHVNALNQLLGSANLKPAQKKAEEAEAGFDSTPFGVWIARWEKDLPIPEPDPEFQDVDNVVRYIEIWFKGHLSKMVGLKNSYSKMYEDEINKLRVERPEFEGDDDEAFFVDIFAKPEADD